MDHIFGGNVAGKGRAIGLCGKLVCRCVVETLEPRSLLSDAFMRGPLQIGLDPRVEGDFNGDGKLDVIGGGFEVPEQFLAGNGDGTFAPPVSLGFSETTLVAGDFNGDGKLDLAAGDPQDYKVRILLGNGDGTFTEIAPVATGDNLIPKAAADFDHDGKIDLLMYVLPNFSQVPITYDTYLAVFKGNGAGAFSSSAGTKSLALTGKPALGDFNGDGNLDVVMAEGAAKIDLFLGDGNGNLAAPLAYDDQAGQAAITTADFNHDGYPDGVSSFSTTPWIRFGGATGLSAPAALTATQYAGLMVESADVNSDGNPDIVVFEDLNNQLDVYFGHGDGTFAAPVGQLIPMTSSAGDELDVGDFNNEGRPDLLTKMGVLLNRPPDQNLPTSTTIQSSVNPVTTRDQTIEITATVSGAGTPRGEVEFIQNGLPYQSAQVNDDGIAILNFLAGAGDATETFTAVYLGDSTHASSASAPLEQVVDSGVPLAVSIVSAKLPPIIWAGRAGIVRLLMQNQTDTVTRIKWIEVNAERTTNGEGWSTIANISRPLSIKPGKRKIVEIVIPRYSTMSAAQPGLKYLVPEAIDINGIQHMGDDFDIGALAAPTADIGGALVGTMSSTTIGHSTVVTARIDGTSANVRVICEAKLALEYVASSAIVLNAIKTVRLQPGSTRQIQIRFRLPPYLKPGDYSLSVNLAPPASAVFYDPNSGNNLFSSNVTLE